MCDFKLEFIENANTQTLQENGFSPVWVCMWHFKLDPSGNAEPQTSQEYSFSPVCFHMWNFNEEFLENAD